MENLEFILSNMHILALFRQYYGITYAQWQYNHALSHGIINATAEESAKTNKEFTESTKPLFDEINKRLNISVQDANHKQVFMDWYRANDEFIKSLSMDEYAVFENIENNYINNDFADSTEFVKIVEELHYDEFIKNQLNNNNAGL